MKKLPLACIHRESHVRMGDFAGWQVPLFYSGIQEEYFDCLRGWGVFDISHLGKVLVHGPGGEDFLEWVSSRSMRGLPVGEGRFTFLLNQRGGIVDGVVIFHEMEDRWLVLTNAGGRERVVAWLNSLARQRPCTVGLRDLTENQFLISIQGPESVSAIKEVFCWDIAYLPRFGTQRVRFQEHECSVARMSFSRLDGLEIRGERGLGESLWCTLLDAVAALQGKLCGFAVRDLLRFEAAFPLYGAEFDETVSPLELGRPDLIDWEKEDFIGRKPLVLEHKQGSKKKLVGLEVEGRRIPRCGFPIQSPQGIPCGYVTSGNYSFRLQKNLAMGLITESYGGIGETVIVSVPRTRVEARIVPLPFVS